MQRHGGTRKFFALAGGEVENDFSKKLVRNRTPESAVEELRAAHEKWKALPEDERGDFSAVWLYTNEGALYKWMRKRGGYDFFVALAGGEVATDFKKDQSVYNRTPESAVEELRALYAQWKALPEDKFEKFNVAWLYKNFRAFLEWIYGHGGIQKFITLAGGDVAEDFEKMEMVRGRTPEMAIEELRAAHARWKALSEDERGKFNVSWLYNHAAGVLNWVYQHGGIEMFVILAGGDVENDFRQTKRKVERGNPLKKELDELLGEVAHGSAQEFRSLINIFGSSRCVDILFRYRSDFQRLPVEYVKGMLGDYLGDFLVAKGEFRTSDVEVALPYLSDLTFREGLFETIKDNCLRFYYSQKQGAGAVGKTNDDIIYGYLGHLVEELGHLKNPALDDIIQDVLVYYDSVLKDFHKPEQFVDALNPNREFPDINQRINMKELKEKKRLVIADEMGLGKSASAIMAKEQLGIACAVVVAPANVVSTWQRYLSPQEHGGYYKTGQAPRVLTVEHPDQLDGVDASTYDYILISQEKMNDRYVEHLEHIDYGMMVVDEFHKFKDISGERTKHLTRLTQKVEGDDKYLALLSGTPVPNKIRDVALTLKLLYPERFGAVGDRELVAQIIQGDIIDLRSVLLPKMQMKSLAESVEMPPLTETIRKVELSELEKEVYEMLLEEDELDVKSKMNLLQKFLLNPDSVDATPGIESSKIQALSEELETAFQTKDKVVVFVNGLIDDVIRGEQTILDHLKLPPGVTALPIHGKNRNERTAIEKQFREAPGKILLLVSGQTADVGVDFSCGDEVIFYNEPWTEYYRRQQLARVYRPGQENPVESTTLIAEETIDAGIHEYILKKYQAIEKLLKGVPISELEKNLLTKTETGDTADAEVNPELARFYFSTWDKMLKMFGYVKEIGEEEFRKFLVAYGEHDATRGEQYAEYYAELGNRSYQANANRVTATLLNRFVREQGKDPESLLILDVASGPEMLRNHIPDVYQHRVVSMDINKEHFQGEGGTRVVGSALKLPFKKRTMDYVTMSLSWHYTNFVPSKERYERIEVLKEMNRVLKEGGRGVLNLIYSFDFKNEEQFAAVADSLGFRIVSEYSGEVEAGSQYASRVITLEKVRDCEGTIDDTIEQIGPDNLNGVKFTKNDKRLRDSRKILTEFEIGGKVLHVDFNKKDKEVFEEEAAITALGERLRDQNKNIRSIPRDQIIENGFVRISTGKRYILFKKLEKGRGVVIIKDTSTQQAA